MKVVINTNQRVYMYKHTLNYTYNTYIAEDLDL